ncbi:PorT family protein [Rhodohalobacter sp. SW132]|uniref:outer membrane beta-barrel protein n=1 Tax=Rhodohalobacter sp. SW132 TaxID=2293433 RepID=UPI000E23F864|nr:outer membrane beta-barrel protein [Rhodohalobacter sp. SW132]REL33767.1 PorT family protein [Rhodohalobacter sp. SW132]
MKRTATVFITLIVCLTINKGSYSQGLQEAEQSVHFGIKGGFNLFAIEGSTIDQAERQSGYQIGLFISSEILNDWVSDLNIRFELNYVEKTQRNLDNHINRVIYDGVELFMDEELHGFEFNREMGGPFSEDEIFNENVHSSVTFHIIEAPIRFIYSVPVGTVTPYVLLGPTFSVVAGFDHSFALRTPQGESHTQTNIASVVDQHYSKINFSADLGMGLHFPYGFFIEGYYSHGFTDSLKFYESNTFHRGFIANLGVRF